MCNKGSRCKIYSEISPWLLWKEVVKTGNVRLRISYVEVLWPKRTNLLRSRISTPTLADFSPTLQVSLLHCRFLSYAAGFSPTLQVSLLHWRISLLRCRFLSYTGGFLSYAAGFSPTLADFSPTLQVSLQHWRISLLRCRFLSYTGGFLSYAAGFSPTLAKCLFSARIYLVE